MTKALLDTPYSFLQCCMLPPTRLVLLLKCSLPGMRLSPLGVLLGRIPHELLYITCSILQCNRFLSMCYVILPKFAGLSLKDPWLGMLVG